MAARRVSLLDNPIIAGFLIAELKEHAAHVETDANGSLLAGPRINLLRQVVREIEQITTVEPRYPAS